MKHLAKRLLPILLLALIVPSHAQSIDKIIKPKKKQSPAFHIKAYYFSPSYAIISSFKNDAHYGNGVGVFRNGALGFSYRIPIYRGLYLQPEALYSFASDWEAATLKNGFLNQTYYAFSHREANFFDIPFHIGYRWQPISIFATRIYAGAMLHFTLANHDFRFQQHFYHVLAGVGLDLLKIFSVDVGYRVGLDGLKLIDNAEQFYASLSFKL